VKQWHREASAEREASLLTFPLAFRRLAFPLATGTLRVKSAGLGHTRAALLALSGLSRLSNRLHRQTDTQTKFV